MPREYYDRSDAAYAAEADLHPASHDQQEGYFLYRSLLTAALARNWQAVIDSSPEIREAADNLESHLQRHSTRTFRIVRAEDVHYTVDAASSLFLR